MENEAMDARIEDAIELLRLIEGANRAEKIVAITNLINGIPDVLNAVNGNVDNLRLAKKIVKKIKDNDGKTHDEAKAAAITLLVGMLPDDVINGAAGNGAAGNGAAGNGDGMGGGRRRRHRTKRAKKSKKTRKAKKSRRAKKNQRRN